MRPSRPALAGSIALLALMSALGSCSSASSSLGLADVATVPKTSAPSLPAVEVVSTASVIVLTLDHATVEGGTAQDPLDYRATAVDDWRSALGGDPTTSNVLAPTGWDTGVVAHEWPGLRFLTPPDGPGWLSVTAAEVNGHPVRTAQGIGVGSTRAEALAAGAVAGYGDELRLDVREVPGTSSLQESGRVGKEFISLEMSGDTVASVHVPANDFSDL
ncbi:hypothetical protein NS220_16230 [Microbacterium testaceum]|uniref:Uncharacterized protein n=1 Tax=Microbacterium testaceum TaxID=2033 RepID=A0A147ETD2_MICTE|nr:hypothetical protein [Microbacterium testaceum]KTR88556.1 hypothetical protein NS220_16230 [Microbacterium testaceum]